MNKKLVCSLAFPWALFSVNAMAAVVGSLGNFDVINDTGKTAHGFEIELEGIHSGDISDIFGGPGRGFPTGRGFDPSNAVVRYGAPTVTDYSDGVTFGARVTYIGLFDSITGAWDFGTPSGSVVTPGDNCWTGGGIGYSAATSCDHFGVGTFRSPTKTTYSWLLETATPGVLTNGIVNIPAPVWNVEIPAVAPGEPPARPIVHVGIVAPEPEDIPGNPEWFGEAIWVKVYTTEYENEVELEALIGGNPVIDGAETEIEWQLLQIDPKKPVGPGNGELELGLGAVVGDKAESIVRRYEFFKFSGKYDEENHEALFDDGFGDSNPGPGDIGTYIGAQNAALNLNAILAVPEPETYGLMLAGLGLMAWARRRS